jgi:hypothetical protein
MSDPTRDRYDEPEKWPPLGLSIAIATLLTIAAAVALAV